MFNNRIIKKTGNKAEINQILGVDYGKRKVGLSIADSETRIAFSYGTLLRGKDFFNELLKIIKKENISTVVIGIPSYINDEEVEYQGEVLGQNIKMELPEIKIEYQNEMFTTKMAQANLKERGMKNIARLDDQEAARIILASWLEQFM